MTKAILGLCGPAGSGKDYVANILVEQYNFVRIAFADEIKRMAMDVFDFSEESLWGASSERNKPDLRYNGLTPRRAIQSLGDWGRSCFPNIWAKRTLDTVQLINKQTKNFRFDHRSGDWVIWSKLPLDKTLPIGVVISDARFKNEMDLIKETGGKVIKIVRPNHFNTLSQIEASHISETEQLTIEDSYFDYILQNNDEVYKNIQEMMKRII